jgi:methionyl-tRNA synthetase
MTAFKRTLVTSALPYANGQIHFGHISGAYLPADIFVRYKRLKGEDIVFICGTDEYGTAIAVSAAKENRTPQEQADYYHERIKNLFNQCQINFDNFSRTTRPHHTQNTQKFFLDLYTAGYIEAKETEQWYSPSSQQFLADRQITGKCYECGFEKARGDECPKCGHYLEALQLTEVYSAIDGTPLEKRKTTNWFLLLDRIQPDLERWVETHPEWKKNVLNKLKDTFKEGLEPRSITRDLQWGVPVPLKEAQGKCIYVWFDAPIGYISSTQEWAELQGSPEKWKEYWLSPESRLLHFIGKDNITFHALIFPAMLLKQSLPYVLPDNVPAHEFLNLEGDKFNKSTGWSIELEDFFEKYSSDTLRYYLARSFPETADSDFLWREFQSKTDELANIYGNLILRVFKMILTSLEGKVPACGSLTESDQVLLQAIQETPRLVGQELEQFHFRQGAYYFLDLARKTNVYFDEQAPWKTRKSDPERFATCLSLCVYSLKTLAVVGYPFIPTASEKLWRGLQQKQKLSTVRGQVQQGWDLIEPVSAGHSLEAVEVLFHKIEEKQIIQEIASLQERKKQKLQETGTSLQREPTASLKPSDLKAFQPLKSLISWEDFDKIDLRIGRILSAEILPKSNHLLKLQVDIGLETRQIIAGIQKSYTPEELRGKEVVVLVNLTPKKIKGEESQGMLLATDFQGKAILLQPVTEVSEGSFLR